MKCAISTTWKFSCHGLLACVLLTTAWSFQETNKLQAETAQSSHSELDDNEEEESVGAKEDEEDDSPFVSGLLRNDGVSDDLFLMERSAGKSTQLGELEWRGFLESDQDGTYRIGAKFTGHLLVELNGRVIVDAASRESSTVLSDPIELEYEYHSLRVHLKPIDGRLALTTFWSGPGFLLEPIPSRVLFRHRSSEESNPVATADSLGGQLFRYLRCEACHTLPNSTASVLRSPSLRGVVQRTNRTWLEQFFTKQVSSTSDTDTDLYSLQHTHQRFTNTETQHLIAWLATLSDESSNESDKSQKAEVEHQPGDPANGRTLVYSLGCLACHQHESLGSRGLFGGGDLTQIHNKLTKSAVASWLRDPADANPQHRMPKFELSETQISDIANFLTNQHVDVLQRSDFNIEIAGDAERGRLLAAEHRCLHCHSEPNTDLKRTTLSAKSNWKQSCVTSLEHGRPDYSFLKSQDSKLVSEFARQLASSSATPQHIALIHENNCLGCHERGSHVGLAPTISSIAKVHHELTNQTAAMKPPALNSVGDKLKDSFLRKVITRDESSRRPWLRVQMPKFALSDEEIEELAAHLIAEDRVPSELSRKARSEFESTNPSDPVELALAARLVTADGFGCTSCHAIGKVKPTSTTPTNQLGPSLSAPGEHLRQTWFDRWVRNPARITPKMEMPSVQIPVPGVLDANLDRQLDAVWNALNQRRFSPPDPLPTRVVRQPIESNHAVVLTDVLQLNGEKLIKPFLIGLPNRQNVLLDLSTSRLAALWSGDVARQRTQGKTWFWEPPTLNVKLTREQPDIVIVKNNLAISSKPAGQFMTEPDSWQRIPNGIELRHRLFFDGNDSAQQRVVLVTQRWRAEEDHVRRFVEVAGLEPNELMGLRADLSASDVMKDSGEAVHRPVKLKDTEERYYVARTNLDGVARFTAEYYAGSPLPSPTKQRPFKKRAKKDLDVMPGFRVQQLPLRDDVMPISMDWKPTGELVVGSLKGQVWIGSDQDGDELRAISDDLAAPYGLHAAANYIDALTKYALIRLHLDDQNNVVRHEVAASGWGHTDDYHDWVVGLPRDTDGSYFVSVPCQQDNRSAAAAKYRGTVLKLEPTKPSAASPRRFRLEQVSAGHRFPMGIAMNRRRQIFVTDNQGNYNPYNELNHVVDGAHFGFINKLERRDDYAPPLTPPAINIPHPWTRSVNGICFLESPNNQHGRFGPFQGHLVGCEYDTRRLIRMTVEEVDGVMQGATYPFCEASTNPAESLQGPINCAVSPDGTLYVANIRDSGWGGANNTGSIVRIEPEFKNLPAGIREIAVLPTGFRIHFTRSVNESLALDPTNYRVSSVRRISTPVYGGDDVDRRVERVTVANYDGPTASVDLKLDEMRTGFVYEFKLKKLSDETNDFYPAEAFYTLKKIPLGRK